MSNQSDATLTKIMSCNIKKLRKNARERGKSPFTQQWCADKIDVVQQQWASWESGRALPSAVNQMKIANLFDITMSELWADGKSPPAKASGDRVDVNRDLVTQCLVVQELLARAARLLAGDINVVMDREALADCSEKIQALAKTLEAVAENKKDRHRIA